MTLDSDLHLWSERAKLLELLGERWDDLLDRVGRELASSTSHGEGSDRHERQH